MTLYSPNSTLTAIQTKVRRLTASSSEQSLSTATINEAINTFYQNDFPYAIKIDQMRSVYTFYTSPNIDRYPLNVNFNQGIRSPVFFEGVDGYFFKDRKEFFNMWPRWPTLYNFPVNTTTGNITAIPNSGAGGPTVVTATNTLVAGDLVTISNVGGMIELNGNTYSVTSTTPTTFTISVDSSAFGVYTSGGLFTSTSKILDFTLYNTPFLSKEFTCGIPGSAGNQIIISDDGNGNLFSNTPNPIIPIASQSATGIYPGLKNQNLSNNVEGPPGSFVQTFPGDEILVPCGNVNYITGVVHIDLTAANLTPANGVLASVWVSQYQVSRPYSMLFWNNELTVRPVPDKTYKVEVETYMTPVQFIENTDNPLMLQWWQYIAYGVAMEIQRERNDPQGVETLREGFMRQEGLVLERQGVEEIGQRNATIFSGTSASQGWNAGTGWPY